MSDNPATTETKTAEQQAAEKAAFMDAVKQEAMEKMNVSSDDILIAEHKFTFKGAIDPETNKRGKPRAPLVLALPLPTMDGIIGAISSNSQALEWVQEVIQNEILGHVRDKISGDDPEWRAQEDVDFSKLSISFIANLPKAERTGGGISKEVWEAWATDYREVMVGEFARDPKKAAASCDLLFKKFNPVKTQKKIITILLDELNKWFSKTSMQDQFASCYAFLAEKGQKLLEEDEEKLANSLI